MEPSNSSSTPVELYSLSRDVTIKQCGFLNWTFDYQACVERAVLSAALVLLLVAFGSAVLWSTLTALLLHPPTDRVRFSAVLSLQGLIVLEAALLSVRLLFFEGAVLEYLTTALRVAVLLLYVQMRLLEYYCATRHAVPYPSRIVYFAPGMLLLLLLCCTAIGERAASRVRCFSFYQVAFLAVEWLALAALAAVSYKHLKRLNRINTEPSVRNYLRCTVVLSVLVFAFGSLINLAYWLFLRSSGAASCSGVFNHDLKVYLPVHSILVITAHILPSLAVLILFYQDAVEYKKIHELERQRLLGQCERPRTVRPQQSGYASLAATAAAAAAAASSPSRDDLSSSVGILASAEFKVVWKGALHRSEDFGGPGQTVCDFVLPSAL